MTVPQTLQDSRLYHYTAKNPACFTYLRRRSVTDYYVGLMYLSRSDLAIRTAVKILQGVHVNKS